MKVKAHEERRKSQVLSDYDVKMEELVNIASAKRRVNRLKHEEKVIGREEWVWLRGVGVVERSWCGDA